LVLISLVLQEIRAEGRLTGAVHGRGAALMLVNMDWPDRDVEMVYAMLLSILRSFLTAFCTHVVRAEMLLRSGSMGGTSQCALWMHICTEEATLVVAIRTQMRDAGTFR
jgi:hypothetical protein